MRHNVVVVWLQRLLVDVVHHIGTLTPDRFDICTLKQPTSCFSVQIAEKQRYAQKLADSDSLRSEVNRCRPVFDSGLKTDSVEAFSQ